VSKGEKDQTIGKNECRTSISRPVLQEIGLDHFKGSVGVLTESSQTATTVN